MRDCLDLPSLSDAEDTLTRCVAIRRRGAEMLAELQHMVRLAGGDASYLLALPDMISDALHDVEQTAADEAQAHNDAEEREHERTERLHLVMGSGVRFMGGAR